MKRGRVVGKELKGKEVKKFINDTSKVAKDDVKYISCSDGSKQVSVGDCMNFVTIGVREIKMVGTIRKICNNGVIIFKNTALVLKEDSLAVLPGEYHVHIGDIKRYSKGKEYFFTIVSK